MVNTMPTYNDARILVIDDDSTNNILIESILHNNGYNYTKSIADSRLAMETFLEYDPELILLDLEMPHLNGFDVFKNFRKLSDRNILPIIVITAKSDHESKTKAIDMGIQYFLEKPLDTGELLARVQNILHINWLYSQTEQKDKLVEENTMLEYGTVESLLLSVKFRDNETGEHLKRVSSMVRMLALSMGLSEETSEKFAIASKLHDIGKIGIPDIILSKEGGLTEDEWVIMKNHTVIGGKILAGSTSKLLKLAGNIAKTHHENWDGTGYPLGISGNSIPVSGKLTALADMFDALMSERPYKKAWEFDEAIKQVKKESGKKLDPSLVDLFMGNMEKIRAIYNGENVN